MNLRKTLLAGCIALLSFDAEAQNRFPTIPSADYNAEQTRAAEEFLAARKTPVFGPFEPLMYNPTLMKPCARHGRLPALTSPPSVPRSASWLSWSPLASGLRTTSGMFIIPSRSRQESKRNWRTVSPWVRLQGDVRRRSAGIPIRMGIEPQQARDGQSLRQGGGALRKAGRSGFGGHLRLLHVPGHGTQHGTLSGPGRRQTLATIGSSLCWWENEISCP